MTQIVLDAVRIIDGTGTDPIDSGRVVIENGVVVDVGPSSSVAVPAGAEVRSLPGATVMPGLIDCHTHLGGTESAYYGDWVLEDDRRQAIVSTLQLGELRRHGVTTIRDISRNGIQLKWAINAGLIPGPRMVACGPGLTRTGGHGDAHHLPLDMVQESHPWGMVADGPEELRKAVRVLNRMGADAVKVWATGGGMWDKELETDQHYDRDELDSIVREASMVGMTVLVHAESRGAAKDALLAGITTLEHGEELDDECRQIMVDRGIIHVPTLQLFLGPWFDEYPPPPRVGLENYRGDTMVEKEKNRVTDNFTATRDAGVTFAVGSDSFSSLKVPFGLSTIEEIRTMVRVGTTPMEAIVAATRNGARALRVEHETGTLEVGKSADLLVLDGDPLTDIEVITPDRMLMIRRGTQVWKDATT